MKKIIIPILSFILFIVLIISPFTTNESNNSNVVGASDTLNEFIKVLENEVTIVNSVKGGDKYRRWYLGKADGQNWCATFVSWAADQVGLIQSKIIPKFQGCDEGVKWFKDKNLYQATTRYGGNYNEPKPGDIIFFSKPKTSNDSTHVGVVISYDKTSETINTIEGNTSNTVAKRNYKKNNDTIIGYGLPNYSLLPTNISIDGKTNEFKYFAKYECQVYTAGRGSNNEEQTKYAFQSKALGYYQFDYTQGNIGSFVNYLLSIDSNKYKQLKNFKWDKRDRTISEVHNLVVTWNQIYKQYPKDFSKAQDDFEYSSYFVPMQRILSNQGINIENRKDCIKGLICGISNLFGNGGAKKLILKANVNNSMSDKEFATKICNTIINSSSNYKYGKSYASRYKKELADIYSFLG